MGRYTTLTEEIQRINGMADIKTQPPCGCEKQNQDLITSSSMEESTDQDKYEDVVFLQGDEAEQPLQILHDEGQDAAMEYLKSWHMAGEHMGNDQLSHGAGDQTYEKDGYIMSWNSHIGYIGLQYEMSKMNQPPQRLPETGVAPDLNPGPQYWKEAVELFNKINKII